MKVEVNKDEEKKKKFNELGLIKPLLKAVEDMEFKTPTRI
jgi:superfamily II DNA/RNA helicase